MDATAGSEARSPAAGPAHIDRDRRFPGRFALTFDDGPHPIHTAQALDALLGTGVVATFFVSGPHVARFPDLIRRIVAEGHALGSHSWTHKKRLPDLNDEQVHAQLDLVQVAIDMTLGRPYALNQVRPPYGLYSEATLAVLTERQDHLVMWQVDSLDWQIRNQPMDDAAQDGAILQETLYGPRSLSALGGGIVLLHDLHPQGPRVLGRLIRAAIDELGLTPTAVAEMLALPSAAH